MKIQREKPVKPVHHSRTRPEKFEEFSAWLEESRLLESTQTKYIFAVRLFFRYFRYMTPRNIKIFFKIEKRRWALDGIRQYIIYKKYDLELPKIDRPPVKKREIPSFEKLGRILKSIDFEDQETEWCLKTCFVTGTSRQNVLSAKYKDIDHKSKALKIPGHGKISIEPIYEKLMMFLDEKGLYNSERLFYTKSKSVAAATHALRYHTKRLKTSDENKRILLRTYNFRRAMRDELLVQSDYNITVVQMRIGDADPKTTMGYVPDIYKERAKGIGQDLLFKGEVYE